MKDSLTEKFPLKKLKIPSNWCVHRSKLYDISPKLAHELSVKYSSENYPFHYFDEELLHIEYCVDRKWTLSLSWNIGFSGNNEKYILSLNNEEWINKSPTYDVMTEDEMIKKVTDSIKLETLSLEEVTDAVNNLMLKISVENGDYENYPEGLQLQEFTPTNYFLCKKNEFFDIEPSEDLTAEQWQLFKEEMLALEPYNSDEWSVKIGWFPAFDPNGQYLVKARYRNLFDELKTPDKEQVTDYLDNVFTVHLKRLGELYAKQQKSEKERQRQARLQIQRNQKV